jgi:transcriptional regulator with XRE-family HTH domain
MMMDIDNLPRILLGLRKRKGITQMELAKYLKVSNKTISKWENGVFLPDIAYLVAIANYYNISVDDLLRGTCFEKDDNGMKRKNQFLFLDLIQLIFFVLLGLLFVLINLKVIFYNHTLYKMNLVGVISFIIVAILCFILHWRKNNYL